MSKKLITMSKFTHYGRFANQIFEYGFLKGYAKDHGCDLQLQPWVGNTLFGLSDPTCDRVLPPWRESGGGLNHSTPPIGDELVGKDFLGYAHYHTSYFIPRQHEFIKYFQPTPEVLARVRPALTKLKTMGSTIIALHFRRGDYGQSIFPITPTSWYLKWLATNWSRFDDPVLFIATEDTSLVPEFAAYDPQTMESLGLTVQEQPKQRDTLKHDTETKNLRSMDMYVDFWLLSQASILLGPASTFSFAAAMLAPQLREYWRATLTAAEFVQADPWNDYPSLREHVKDFPHLEGIALKENEYWGR